MNRIEKILLTAEDLEPEAVLKKTKKALEKLEVDAKKICEVYFVETLIEVYEDDTLQVIEKILSNKFSAVRFFSIIDGTTFLVKKERKNG